MQVSYCSRDSLPGLIFFLFLWIKLIKFAVSFFLAHDSHPQYRAGYLDIWRDSYCARCRPLPGEECQMPGHVRNALPLPGGGMEPPQRGDETMGWLHRASSGYFLSRTHCSLDDGISCICSAKVEFRWWVNKYWILNIDWPRRQLTTHEYGWDWNILVLWYKGVKLCTRCWRMIVCPQCLGPTHRVIRELHILFKCAQHFPSLPMAGSFGTYVMPGWRQRRRANGDVPLQVGPRPLSQELWDKRGPPSSASECG